MKINIYSTPQEMGRAAADQAAKALRAALASHRAARLVLATGASQFELLENLVAADDLDWRQVTCFHLDEYIGLPADHPASFRKYLNERFVSRTPVLEFHFVQGDAPDPRAECQRLQRLLHQAPVDLALVGIGENGHLAFNDPPADFEADEAYIVVDLDEACRRQQVSEGWFPSLDAVPRQAISMTIQQIMRSRQIICTVPDQRKAGAVQRSLEDPVTPDCPASVLQLHPDCTMFLDEAAASGLSRKR
jgi:glucosamine-6-phosphate deaminase